MNDCTNSHMSTISAHALCIGIICHPPFYFFEKKQQLSSFGSLAVEIQHLSLDQKTY